MLKLPYSFLLSLVLLCAASCGGHAVWQFRLAPDNGVAQIDMDGVTLVFEDVPLGGVRGSSRTSDEPQLTRRFKADTGSCI
ncbi:MAG: hypothetical protein ACI835_001600 [Planctomycetota bacterium]|jgi:hypothetical protein